MRHSLILMIVTILSKIIGLLREISLSYVYGTGPIADAFLVSFFIPSVFINGITLGIATGVIPIYSNIHKLEGKVEGDKFISNLSSIIFIISLGVTLLGLIFTDEIMSVLALGFDDEIKSMAVFFTRMVMASVVIASVGGVFRGYLQFYKNFSITVLNQVIMNGIIILSIFISKKFGYKAIGIGTGIGMTLQYLVFIPFLKKLDYKYTRTVNFKDRYFRDFQRLSLPVLFGVLINETNLIVDKAIASTLRVGAISALNYSSGIQDFVVGVVILSIATVRYTEMSKLSVNHYTEELKKNYNITLKMTLFLVIPASLGLMVFSKEIIGLLFYRGAFDLESLAITSKALFFYSLGLVGISLNTIGQRIFYARRQILEPVLLSIGSVILNIILNIILSKFLGIAGLALGTSISMTITGIVTLILLKKNKMLASKETFINGVFKSSLNSILVIFMARMIYNFSPSKISLLLGILLAIILYIIIGIKIEILYKEDLMKLFNKKTD